MTSAKNGGHFEKNFSTILLFLCQVIYVPSFMAKATSKLNLLEGGRIDPPPGKTTSKKPGVNRVKKLYCNENVVELYFYTV